MNKIKIRHPEITLEKHLWIVDNPDSCRYIQPDGTEGRYHTYRTKAEAQAAFDLCLEKEKSKSTKVILTKSPEYYGQLKSEVEVPTKLFGHPQFYEILKQMEELHSRKNHDYAGTSDPLKNLRACERLKLKPFMGVMVRLQDKWSRLEEFVKSGKLMVKNESVIDTLMDNAVYSVLAIILYEEQQKEEDYDAAIDHETGTETTPGYGGKIDRDKPVPGGY